MMSTAMNNKTGDLLMVLCRRSSLAAHRSASAAVSRQASETAYATGSHPEFGVFVSVTASKTTTALRSVTIATLPSQKQSAFLSTATPPVQQLRAFHTTTVRPFADGDAKKEGTGDQEEQPHGTASVSFVESEEDVVLPTEEDDMPPKHPIESLQGGDPALYTVPIVVKMPDVLDSDEEHNTIEKWYKEEGDIIKPNDLLCDIATPAFTFGMVTEDDEDAIMGEIHVAEGDMARDDAPICTIYHMPEEGAEEATTKDES